MLSVVLKDYIDHLHDLSLFGDYAHLSEIAMATFSYVFQSFYLAFWYLISFQWLRDFAHLPATLKYNLHVVTEGFTVLKPSFLGAIKGKSVAFGPDLVLDTGTFKFLDVSPLNTKSLFSGFINSFFLCLPLSLPHILSARSLMLNGLPAGIASALGTIFGQILFATVILFGFEWLLQPFFQFEPIVIISGFAVSIDIVTKIARKADQTVYSIRQTSLLISCFRDTFLLTWFEQACVANYFGNLSINNSATALEATGGNFFLLTTLAYIIGLVIGSCIWAILFGMLVLKIQSIVSSWFPNVGYLDMKVGIHYVLLPCMITLASISFPYYGYDYVGTSTIGYIHEDAALDWGRPANRHVLVMTEQDQEEGVNLDFYGELISEGRPFQEPELHVETAPELSLDFEPDFYMRATLRERQVEKEGLGQKNRSMLIPYVPDLNLAKEKETRYATPHLIESEDDVFATDSDDLNAFEVLLEKAFRTDNNLLLRDLHSESYIPETQLYRKFREKYFSNPVYNAILAVNTLPDFLMGQPKENRLSPNDEFNLYARRNVLANYLDSAGKYRFLVEEEELCYPEKVYNQQFKGSLNFIRRFNAVQFSEYGSEHLKGRPNLSEPQPPLKTKVLKYDQPLYKDKKRKNEQKQVLHEELKIKKKDSKITKKSDRFLELTVTQPLYMGWDESLHKFMVKTVRVTDTLQKGPEFDSETQNAIEEAVDSKPATYKPPVPYYTFQAWSPGVENAKPGSSYKLPDLVATDKDILLIKKVFELTDKDDEKVFIRNMDEEGFSAVDDGPTSALAVALKRVSLDALFKRLPVYDWFWSQQLLMLSENEFVPAFRLGDATPPGIDGIAWPGQGRRRPLFNPMVDDEELLGREYR